MKTKKDNIKKYLMLQIKICDQYKGLFFERYALKGMLNFYSDHGKIKLLESLKNHHCNTKDIQQRYFFNSEYSKILNIEP